LAISAQYDPCLSLGVPTWTNSRIQFTFAGESGVTYFVEASADLENWVQILTNSDPGITRVITVDASAVANFYRAARAPLPMFVAGLAAKEGVSLIGNNIITDAYDSADPVHFTNGFWNSTYALLEVM